MAQVFIVYGEIIDGGATLIAAYNTEAEAIKHKENITWGDLGAEMDFLHVAELNVKKKYKKYKQPLLIPDAN
jgi:hypothetical protein